MLTSTPEYFTNHLFLSSPEGAKQDYVGREHPARRRCKIPSLCICHDERVRLEQMVIKQQGGPCCQLFSRGSVRVRVRVRVCECVSVCVRAYGASVVSSMHTDLCAT